MLGMVGEMDDGGQRSTITQEHDTSFHLPLILSAILEVTELEYKYTGHSINITVVKISSKDSFISSDFDATYLLQAMSNNTQR